MNVENNNNTNKPNSPSQPPTSNPQSNSNSKKPTKEDEKSSLDAKKSHKRAIKLAKRKHRREKRKAFVRDLMNPNSEFKGPGRIFQLTGTAKKVKSLVDASNGVASSSGDSQYSNEPTSRLKRWFDEEWVDIKTGKPCGRKSAKNSDREYPACRPSKRITPGTPKTSKELSTEEKQDFTKVKNSKQRINYTHKKSKDIPKDKTKYRRSEPEDKTLYNKVKEEAKQKFNKWPSAYASGWLQKTYKKRGGKFRTVNSNDKNYHVNLLTLEEDKKVIDSFLQSIEHKDEGTRNSLEKTFSNESWKVLQDLCNKYL